jgi:hypothetical protein
MHPRFKTLDKKAQQWIVERAQWLLENDSFFIGMPEQIGQDKSLESAIGTATNVYLRGIFHKKFGKREL